jgi:hypothetical protein
MKVLALEKDLNKESGNPDLMVNEAERVYKLYKEGKIREIYFQKQNHTAVIVLEVQDISEARNIYIIVTPGRKQDYRIRSDRTHSL